MIFQDLVSLESRLQDLLSRAKAVKDVPDDGYFCANEVFVGMRQDPSFLRELRRLVGFYAPADAGSILRSSEAYDLAYETINGALPECRDCVCWDLTG